MFNNAGKLFKLKKWLTIPESAKYLSKTFGEEVNEADVLRLGIDGHLKLSVYFVNGAIARFGKVVSYEEAEWYPPNWISLGNSDIPEKFKNMKKLDTAVIMKSLNIDNSRYLNLEDDVTPIRGVWDLAMVGNEGIDVEYEYNQLINGPEVELIVIDGTFVEDVNDKTVMCQIQESFDDNEFQSGSKAQLEGIKNYINENNIEEFEAKKRLDRHKKNREKFLKEKNKNPSNCYFPAGKLPNDSILIVRTQALIDLQNQIADREKDTEFAALSEIKNSDHKINIDKKNISPLGPSEQHLSFEENNWHPLKAATLIGGFSYNSLVQILKENINFKIPSIIMEIYKKSYKAFSNFELKGKSTTYSLDFLMKESDKFFFKRFSPEFLTHDDFESYYIVVFNPQIYLNWIQNNTEFKYSKKFDLLNTDQISKDTSNGKNLMMLSSKEKQELGRLRTEKITMDSAIKAAIEVGVYLEKVKMKSELIVRSDISDLINKIDIKIPNTRIDLIWKSIPDEIKSGPGRRKKK
jgi:hypothetical protein